jgi:hypothetical protein
LKGEYNGNIVEKWQDLLTISDPASLEVRHKAVKRNPLPIVLKRSKRTIESTTK